MIVSAVPAKMKILRMLPLLVELRSLFTAPTQAMILALLHLHIVIVVILAY